MIEQLIKKRGPYFTGVLHLLVWSIILLLPFLSSNSGPRQFQDYIIMWLPPLVSAVIFYINYFYLIPKLLFTQRTPLFLASNVMLYALLILGMEHVRGEFLPPATGHHGPGQAEMIVRIFITFTMTMGVSVALRITSAWFESEASRKELEKEHIKSELINLKNQLNPHFFFNTLNTIYGLIPQHPEKAQSAVHRLSKLMRYHLYDSDEKFVPLEQEINFINSYMDLMRLRLTPSVTITCEFPSDTRNLQVAPLLFISLIENAFKHGTHSNKPSSIDMRIDIGKNKTIVFQVRNTVFIPSAQKEPGSGIGIENLKKRLSLLYPNRHELRLDREAEHFNCILTLTT